MAFREFPALRQMTTEQIRHFGDRISRHSWGLATDIAHLAHAAGETDGAS